MDDDKKSLWDHIYELRFYSLVCFIAVLVGSAIAHAYYPTIVEWFLKPLGGQKLVFLSPLEPLFFVMKVDMFVGFMLALPVILVCIFKFVSPAFSIKKLFAWAGIIVLSLFLSICAVLYTYYVILPLSLGFISSIKVPGIENMFTAEKYVGFLMIQTLMSVLIFHIPIFFSVASAFGVFNPALIKKKRRYVYVAVLIVLAVVTPTTDIMSLGLVTIPTLVILEVSVLLSRVFYSRYRRSV